MQINLDDLKIRLTVEGNGPDGVFLCVDAPQFTLSFSATPEVAKRVCGSIMAALDETEGEEHEPTPEEQAAWRAWLYSLGEAKRSAREGMTPEEREAFDRKTAAIESPSGGIPERVLMQVRNLPQEKRYAALVAYARTQTPEFRARVIADRMAIDRERLESYRDAPPPS